MWSATEKPLRGSELVYMYVHMYAVKWQNPIEYAQYTVCVYLYSICRVHVYVYVCVYMYSIILNVCAYQA